MAGVGAGVVGNEVERGLVVQFLKGKESEAHVEAMAAASRQGWVKLAVELRESLLAEHREGTMASTPFEDVR
jgi:hypothetical protein